MPTSSIIVIGNGPSILNYEYGKIIDNFKDVVRFNNFQIEGYEKYIGTKTTIWARSNSNRIKERDNSLFNQIFMCNPPKNFCSHKNYLTAKKMCFKVDNMIMLPENEKDELQKELGLYGHSRAYYHRKNKLIGDKPGWPSAGLIVLNYLIRRYPTVYIHGFDNFEKIDNAPRHYYNNVEKMPTSKMHKGDREKEWINKRYKQGIIKFL